jgi:hypothetical protein
VVGIAYCRPVQVSLVLPAFKLPAHSEAVPKLNHANAGNAEHEAQDSGGIFRGVDAAVELGASIRGCSHYSEEQSYGDKISEFFHVDILKSDGEWGESAVRFALCACSSSLPDSDFRAAWPEFRQSDTEAEFQSGGEYCRRTLFLATSAEAIPNMDQAKARDTESDPQDSSRIFW